MPGARLMRPLRTGSGAFGGRTARTATRAAVMSLSLAPPLALPFLALPLALRPGPRRRATAVALAGVPLPVGGAAAGLPLGSARKGRVDGGGRATLADVDLLTAKLGNQLT